MYTWVGGEELVTGLEGEGTEDGVDALGGVGDKAEIGGVDVEELSDGLFGGGDEIGEAAAEDFGWGSRFDAQAPLGLLIEDTAGDCTERAVIEEGDIFRQEEVWLDVGAEGRRGESSLFTRARDNARHQQFAAVPSVTLRRSFSWSIHREQPLPFSIRFNTAG